MRLHMMKWNGKRTCPTQTDSLCERRRYLLPPVPLCCEGFKLCCFRFCGSIKHTSLSLSLSSKKQLQLLTPTPNPNTCSSSNLPTVCKPTILKPESEHTKMVTRLQQGSTNTQFYCHNLLRNQSKTKIQGFGQFQTHPKTKGEKTNKLEMFVTSKCTSKPSRNQKTETEQP
jgi:hypothetical protein